MRDLGGVGASVAATFRRAACEGCWPDRAWTRLVGRGCRKGRWLRWCESTLEETA